MGTVNERIQNSAPFLYQAVYGLLNFIKTTVSTRPFHNYSPELLQD